MSALRPECKTSRGDALPDATAYYLIADAVARRRELIHGQLHAGAHHCAMGAFWEDNPKATVHTSLVDEVAAVNDSLGPGASMRERHKKVLSWLRWRLRTLAAAPARRPA